MGMYKEAKSKKVPLLQVLQKKKDELTTDLQRNKLITSEEAQEFTEKLLFAWITYAKKRLPRFKNEDQF